MQQRPWIWSISSIAVLILTGHCVLESMSTLRDGTQHPFRRTLQGACVPQQYPKQGALLPVTLPGRILDVVWPSKDGPSSETSPDAHKYVYALVADTEGFPGGPLWRSDYHGKADSWKDVTPQLAAAIPANDTNGHAGVVAVHWHPTRPERILFQGRGRYHFVTSDGGATFVAAKTPGYNVGYIQEIKPHPRQADWLLAKARRDVCSRDYHADECAVDLWVSKDFGATWSNLTAVSNGQMAGVRDFEWGCKLPQFAGKPTPDDAVFATIYPGNHHGLYPGWEKSIHYVVTLDLFASPFAKVVPCGNLFEIMSGKVFLAVPSDCPIGPDGKAHKAGSGAISSRSITLYVSDGDGDEFVEACLPALLEDDGYNLVYTHDESAAFVLADHAEPGSWSAEVDSPTSDAYAPAYNASLHTMSLADVYRREFVTDFSRIEGVPGAYIANRLDPEAKGLRSRGKEAAFLQTRVTRNGGAAWEAIRRPSSFRFGQCNACAPGAPIEQCSLHLHGPTSWFAPEGPHPNFYSLPSAPGLMLATGNVGAHLDLSPDADCTYISRDGGSTWEDIADKTAIYEIGNFGALVAMAAHRSEGPTDSVSFSLDQGACFHTVKLPEAILVDNVRIAPGGAGHVFLVHGMACLKTESHKDCGFTGGSTPQGKLYAIDVQELLGANWKECDATEGSADYETWTLSADSASACVLGAKRTLRRRTRDAFCFNPLGWKAEIQTKETCECTVMDVECEFGYARSVNNSCEPMYGVAVQEACPRLVSSGYRTSSSHMRLVHGNLCKGVNNIIPDTNGRGGAKGSDKPGGGGGAGGGGGSGPAGHSAVRSFFVFVVVCGVVAVAGGLTWTHCLNADQRTQLTTAAAPVLGSLAVAAEMGLGVVVEVYDWCRAKLRSLLGRDGGGMAYFDGRSGYEPLGGGRDGGFRGLDMLPEEDDYRSPSSLGGQVGP